MHSASYSDRVKVIWGDLVCAIDIGELNQDIHRVLLLHLMYNHLCTRMEAQNHRCEYKYKDIFASNLDILAQIGESRGNIQTSPSQHFRSPRILRAPHLRDETGCGMRGNEWKFDPRIVRL